MAGKKQNETKEVIYEVEDGCGRGEERKEDMGTRMDGSKNQFLVRFLKNFKQKKYFFNVKF